MTIKCIDITDSDFHRAVTAIDEGDLAGLKGMIEKQPQLLSERLITENHGYFKEPYLLYFVADNPIRIDILPSNIIEITRYLVSALKDRGVSNLQEQLNYTLGLIATGRIPKECGVQIGMMDLLIDEGATPGSGLGALAHGNIEAAKHLISKGGKLILPTAVALNMKEDVKRLLPVSDDNEKLTALTAAAFYGNAEIVSLLLSTGIGPNSYPANSGFHTHATPLHQAISAGSPECVKLLVEAGADLTMRDKIYNGTPLEWAKHMQTDGAQAEQKIEGFKAIEAYLIQTGNR